jgi:hypothetical protein
VGRKIVPITGFGNLQVAVQRLQRWGGGSTGMLWTTSTSWRSAELGLKELRQIF